MALIFVFDVLVRWQCTEVSNKCYVRPNLPFGIPSCRCVLGLANRGRLWRAQVKIEYCLSELGMDYFCVFSLKGRVGWMWYPDFHTQSFQLHGVQCKYPCLFEHGGSACLN